MACRSILFRILQAAEDDQIIPSNPVRKVQAPKRTVDPEAVFGRVRRRAYTPEELGRFLAPARCSTAITFWCRLARGIPARVIDELMGRHTGRRRDRDGSAIGVRYRHMTQQMQARVVAVIERQLASMSQACPKRHKPGQFGG